MRVSCNGCRVLRKGCSDNCSIRPCLQWIKSPESQANATVFLAKFYGRAGLQNLINAGPDNLRPAIFRSLLYEACGRIVNPIYGSAGLLWSGNWHLCHAAVEAVLSGSPIVQVSPDSAVSSVSPPLKACDIRHVSKDESSAASRDLHRVRVRGRFKRGKGAGKPKAEEVERSVDDAAQVIWSWSNHKKDSDGSASHVESASHNDSASVVNHHGGDAESVSMEASVAKGEVEEGADGSSDVELELKLGFEPFVRRGASKVGEQLLNQSPDATFGVNLRLN